MLMYTSCGWFFDELSGIETVQVIQYAGRAAQLAEELFGNQVQDRFIEMLSKAKSNIPENGDGGRIYQKFVQPAFVDLRKVGAHYAIRSLFEPYETDTHIYCYKAERQAEPQSCRTEPSMTRSLRRGWQDSLPRSRKSPQRLALRQSTVATTTLRVVF